ncbi:MAG: HAMP domain-containing protein [Deltaproteobacteria bacterium]|nr:HAMP domain-containing protein [Deltaproteobacteria bacterium]
MERSIQDKALSVAKQIEIFIKADPKKKIGDLLKDSELQAIAVQEVGENDYTAVFDKEGLNYFHINPEFVGKNIRDLFQQNPEMLKIMEGGLKDATSGYYDWTDKDGKSIPKFIYVKPIPDTDLVLVADASVEELSRPSSTIESRVTRIESRYLNEYEKNFKVFFLIILGTFIVIVIVFVLFSRSLVYPIHHLSEVADRISMGDLDTPIDVKAKGEVGVLAESIERMQASVRAAIKRLQRSRGETET